MSSKLLVVIGGPTGVGKTALAIRLAQYYGTEIVSADSRQIYKELNIGAGKPSPEQMQLVPHHLIGHVSIFQHYSAGHFAEDALALLHRLFAQHDIVFVTGGTGLYVRALVTGMDDMPHVPEEINVRWTVFWKEKGIGALTLALEQLDPDYLASMADRANPARLIRALAVSEASGKPYSSFRTGKTVDHPFDILPIVLDLPRRELYDRINARVNAMMDQGWLEEALALYPYREMKALRTVGYPELFEHIEGKTSLKEAVEKIQQSTRRYAKRQVTWWRRGEWHRFHPEDDAGIKELAGVPGS